MMISTDFASLWMWPIAVAKANLAAAEIMSATPKVVGARLPLIFEALANPWLAPTAELTRMVTEKADAARLSNHAISTVATTVRTAAESNSRDLRRLAAGTWIGPFEFWNMFERNLAVFAALAALPGEALAPIHVRVTGNARRLRG